MRPLKGERLELGLPSGTVLGQEVWHYHEVDSTNEVCKDLAASGVPEGCCVVADGQTGGRGRLGRTWFSPPGEGLYLSCLLRPQLSPEALPLCTLMAGGATARALVGATGADVRLKWPNDLTVEEKKLGGILTELLTPPGETPAVVVGIGINVTTPPEAFPPDLATIAISLLQATGRAFERVALLKAILLELGGAYSAFRQEGPTAVLAAWRAFATTLGQRVLVTMTDGTVEGEAVSLTETGHLVVQTAEGHEVEVLAGDVVHLRIGPPP
ncbi:MAG: biotin--[acetyl-CoA-carboxylase] ligase [Nitrospinota bacterium]